MKKKDCYEIILPPSRPGKLRSGVRPGRVETTARQRAARWRKRKHRKPLTETE